jgi:hypothetical protein
VTRSSFPVTLVMYACRKDTIDCTRASEVACPGVPEPILEFLDFSTLKRSGAGVEGTKVGKIPKQNGQ